MPEALYQRLSADDRRYALRVAQDRSRRRAFLLEKDIWVVATLGVLFDSPFAQHLTFKGGTQGRHFALEGMARDPAFLRRCRHHL